MEKTSKCVKRVVYVCPTPDNCGYFEQYKDKPFCCKYRTDGNAICTCKEAIEEAKGQPKRTPLPDGTLELTEEELGEFFKMGRHHQNDGSFPVYYYKKVTIEDGSIRCEMYRRGLNYEKFSGNMLLTNIKAILWLADRFNLEG